MVRVLEPRDSARGLRCLWPPLPRQLLRFGDLVRGHLWGSLVSNIFAYCISLRSREVAPHMG